MSDEHEPRMERINGRMYRLTPIRDQTGKLLHHIATPFHIDLTSRDLLQIIAGAALFTVPMAFTGEVWELGSQLPIINVMALSLISVVVVSLFVYLSVYRAHMAAHFDKFVQRVAATLLLSLFIAALLLTLLDQAPWQTDWLVALKRTLIVAFPASLSAAISDRLE